MTADPQPDWNLPEQLRAEAAKFDPYVEDERPAVLMRMAARELEDMLGALLEAYHCCGCPSAEGACVMRGKLEPRP